MADHACVNICFDQLLGARSTQKLVEIHNTQDFKVSISHYWDKLTLFFLEHNSFEIM